MSPTSPPIAGQPAASAENPDKEYITALLLSYFLGGLGVERFYLGKNVTAVLKLVTLGGLGIWHVVDLLLLAFNKLHAKNDSRPLKGYAKNRGWVKIAATALIIFNVLCIVGAIVIIFAAVPASLEHADQVRQEQRRLEQRP